MSKLDKYLMLEAKKTKPVTPKQMKNAIDHGMDAFWATIADFIPQAKTGDMDPGAVNDLERSMKKAVKIWVEYNVPTE